MVGSLIAALAVSVGPAAGVADQMSDSPTAKAAKKKRTTKVTLRDSQFGPMLFDRRGQAIYLFTKDGKGPSQCFGTCAEEWPPFMKRGKLVAGQGVDRSKLGSVARTGGGRQVTYAGQPLYFYANEGRGQVLCHNVNSFGGLWLVVQANGQAAPA